MADESATAIAVDLGGTKILAGLVRRDGSVVRQILRPTVAHAQEALLEAVELAIEEVRDRSSLALGVGVPSMVDQRTGTAVMTVNAPLADFPLRDSLHGRFGLPVAVDNDANLATLAEHRLGAGRGSDHMVMLTLGTGIGGGLILDGKLYRGAVGAAAELGHITLALDGAPCQGACPGLGHFESLCSGTAVDRLAQQVARERPAGDLGRAGASGAAVDARLAVELARVGKGDARELLEAVGRRLGVGIASLVNIFNPQLVVVGGGFAQAGELLLEPARRVVAEQALAPARDTVRIVTAMLGPEAGLVGAGLAGFEAFDAVALTG